VHSLPTLYGVAVSSSRESTHTHDQTDSHGLTPPPLANPVITVQTSPSCGNPMYWSSTCPGVLSTIFPGKVHPPDEFAVTGLFVRCFSTPVVTYLSSEVFLLQPKTRSRCHSDLQLSSPVLALKGPPSNSVVRTGRPPR
jgi:hypothetical protein